jgi:hypothetical protein
MRKVGTISMIVGRDGDKGDAESTVRFGTMSEHCLVAIKHLAEHVKDHASSQDTFLSAVAVLEALKTTKPGQAKGTADV